ncbi:NAD dependent epimerase/dehydratase [Madurella fahalii]|uniref:NAD dependent epimerase/dehydratase n=1 Tax=Madurella fahalii TaxID=1157608 RepID=A0ABQ0GLL8_9PEZI
MPSLNGWFYHLLERYVYAVPDPPPRKRTKPMQVLCVGLPRSGTESLQHALLKLGYDHTFHGWDIIYEEPNYCQQWVRLCRKKFFGPLDGKTTITAAEFDALMGHSVAVTDAAASVFAPELIAAYPDAKVILNYRKDMDAWHRSATNTLVRANKHWALWLLSRLDRQCFWAWHLYVDFMWPGLFRALDGNIETGIARNGRWVYREHCNMIRGLVPKDRLLEWCVEDGWEPLCEFLNKPVPDEPFPHANAASGWQGQEMKLGMKYIKGAATNLAVILSLLVGAGSMFYKYYH